MRGPAAASALLGCRGEGLGSEVSRECTGDLRPSDMARGEDVKHGRGAVEDTSWPVEIVKKA